MTHVFHACSAAHSLKVSNDHVRVMAATGPQRCHARANFEPVARAQPAYYSAPVRTYRRYAVKHLYRTSRRSGRLNDTARDWLACFTFFRGIMLSID